MFRSDLKHTDVTTETVVPPLTKMWNFTTGSYVVSSPAVSGGVVYVGSWDGNVYAFSSGTPVPEFPGSIVFLTVLIGVLMAMLVERKLGRQRSPV